MDFKKIIAFLCVLSICFSFCVPAFADLGNGQFEVTDIWDWYLRNTDDSFIKFIVTHRYYDTGCPDSPSGYHDWVYPSVLDPAYYSEGAHCSYCGSLFRYYDVAPGSWDDAYDSYVSDLPVNAIDNLGGYYFTTSEFYLDDPYQSGTTYVSSFSNSFRGFSASLSDSSVVFECIAGSASNAVVKNSNNIGFSVFAYFPLSGRYYSSDVYGGVGQIYKVNPITVSCSSPGIYGCCTVSRGAYTVECSAPISFTYRFTPSNTIDDSSYTEESRFTNYTFNLGTVYNGDVTYVYQNQTIINETNMTLTNPSTGTTYNITNWIYNYTDRSVSGETEDGDTYNVQFGDQYLVVSIDEDDYYYYYVIEHPVCDHHYVITDQTPPSCTASGSVTYTCSECGDTYTDTVPALGHNYQFVQSVPASGEDPGYDLFRCTRCGDEYTDSTFFNDDSDDANYWAWLKTWLQSFWNWLGDKLDAILDKDTTVNVDQDVNIDLPDVNIDFQYVDEAGEQQTWNPGELRSKFAFWKDVRDIGIELYDSVQPTAVRNGAYNPPELIIHLGAAESNYGVEYGGDEYAMDLSWYEPYKSTVDSIAGGFLWLLYLYGVWKHLPDIFSGAGMLENRMSDLQAGERHSRRRERD